MCQRHQPQIPPAWVRTFSVCINFFLFQRELFCFFFFSPVRASDTFFDSHLRSHRVKKMRPREIAAGGRGLFAAPAPIPLSRGVPGGRRDHDFLLHPVLCWGKGHLPAEQHWHTSALWLSDPLKGRSGPVCFDKTLGCEYDSTAGVRLTCVIEATGSIMVYVSHHLILILWHSLHN